MNPTSGHGAADVALLTFVCVCVMLADDAVSVADRLTSNKDNRCRVSTRLEEERRLRRQEGEHKGDLCMVVATRNMKAVGGVRD